MDGDFHMRSVSIDSKFHITSVLRLEPGGKVFPIQKYSFLRRKDNITFLYFILVDIALKKLRISRDRGDNEGMADSFDRNCSYNRKENDGKEKVCEWAISRLKI